MEDADRPGPKYLCDQFHAAIDQIRREWFMTYAEVLGCLEIVKYDILEEMSDPDEPEEYFEEIS